MTIISVQFLHANKKLLQDATRIPQQIASLECRKCGEVFGILDVHFCKPDTRSAEAQGEGQSNDLAVKQIEDLDWNASTKL